MPSKKRRRAASADANAATHGSVATSFERYRFLPLELREYIIEIACLSPRLASSPHPPSPFGVDSGTMFSLSLVCHAINAQVTPLLWRTISITCPSSLYALREALLARPDRRKLIVSLHIGPQDGLPSYWWPLSTVDHRPQERVNDEFIQRGDAPTTHEWFASSLDQERLPFGCVDRQAWCYERRPAGCRGSAIFEAIKEAERSLDVILLDNSSEHPLHIERVILVQAVLDLYLEAVRRVEEHNPSLVRLAQPGARVPLPCRNGQCHHYPSLRLSDIPSKVGSSTSAWKAPQHQLQAIDDVIVLTYAELLRHLGRPGATTDRFDHPIILERSHFKIRVNAPRTSGTKTYYPSSARYSIVSNTYSLDQHVGHRWDGEASLRSAAARPKISKEVSDSYSAVMLAATIGSILRLAQNVLYLAKHVQNLSLSGFLQGAAEAAGGNERGLPNLRRLSIGPALPGWEDEMPRTKLVNLEDLRIAGQPTTSNEAAALLDAAPKLQRVSWSIPEELPRGFGMNVEDVIYSFMTHKGSTSTSTSNNVEEPRVDSVPTLLIAATLHPTDVTRVLNTAPSPDVQAAWREGRATSPNVRRLLLKESAAVQAVEEGLGRAVEEEDGHAADPSQDSHSCFWETMYEEERGWWGGELD